MKKQFVLILFSFLTIYFSNVAPANELQGLLSDADIRQKIVGTWIVNLSSIKGTVTIASDGRFVSRATLNLANSSQIIRYEGIWQIESGVLIEKITKSNSKLLPAGHITRDKIIHINRQELVYQMENGKTVTRKRSNNM